MTIALVRPTLDLFESWAEAVVEFGDVHIDGGRLDADTKADLAGCAAFVEKARVYSDGSALPERHVPCDYFWIVDGAEVVGFIAFRRELNDYLREAGGHIGYSVRPSRRREGIASAALALVLDRAREQGYERVMLTCDEDNFGSRRTIEGAGGELQDIREMVAYGHEVLRRYWIAL